MIRVLWLVTFLSVLQYTMCIYKLWWLNPKLTTDIIQHRKRNNFTEEKIPFLAPLPSPYGAVTVATAKRFCSRSRTRSLTRPYSSRILQARDSLSLKHEQYSHQCSTDSLQNLGTIELDFWLWNGNQRCQFSSGLFLCYTATLGKSFTHVPFTHCIW